MLCVSSDQRTEILNRRFFENWNKNPCHIVFKKKVLYFEWSPPWHVGWRLSGEGCHLAPEVEQSGSEFKTVWDANCWRTTLCFSIKTSASSETAASTAPDKVPFSHHACNTSPSIQHPSLEHAKAKSKCHTLRPPGFHLVDHKVNSPHPLTSAWSGQVKVDMQLTSWNAFCCSQLRRLTGSNLLTFFLTYLLTFFLTNPLTCFLTYLLTFFLTYQNQNLTSTASQKKQLCKLYIYLTPRSKSNIHDNFVPVKCHRKKQLSPRDAILAVVPQLHLMACANHEARALSPLLCRWLCSAHHLFPIRALQSPKTRPKCERLQHASPALARPPHLEQTSLHTPHTTGFPPQLLAR